MRILVVTLDILSSLASSYTVQLASALRVLHDSASLGVKYGYQHVSIIGTHIYSEF